MQAHDANSGYDVCFVDWRMPGINGLEVTKKSENCITRIHWLSLYQHTIWRR